jgi:hypothetical protein
MKDFISLDLIFYKAECEKKKWPWDSGYWSQKIAQHAKGDHSHVEYKFTFSDGDVICFSSSEQDKGTRFKSGSSVLKNPDRWDTIHITRDYKTITNVWNFCVDQQGKKYDWWGVIRFKLSFINEDSKKWYCSEICQYGLWQEKLFPRLYSIHPEDMFRIARFIYKKKEV